MSSVFFISFFRVLFPAHIFIFSFSLFSPSQPLSLPFSRPFSHEKRNKKYRGGAAIITPTVLLATGVAFFALVLGGDAFSPVLAKYGLTPLMAAVFVGAAQNVFSKSAKYSLFDPCKEMVRQSFFLEFCFGFFLGLFIVFGFLRFFFKRRKKISHLFSLFYPRKNSNSNNKTPGLHPARPRDAAQG